MRSAAGLATLAPPMKLPRTPAADAPLADGAREEGAPLGWPARAQRIHARPHDRGEGSRRFAELWRADRHGVVLAAAELERLASALQYVAVPAAQELIGQDEPGDYLVVVLQGRLAVERVRPDGGRARLAEAREGDMLGEMSLLDAGARFSACTTLTPCVLAVLDACQLDGLMKEEPRLALALVASLARRLSLRLREVSARLSALLAGA